MAVRRGARRPLAGGSRLEPEAAGYFRRALETLQEGLSEEELALFAPNVLAEAAAAAPGIALDAGGSRLLRALLPAAPLEPLARLLPPLVAGGLGGAAGHPRGGRVLEAALSRLLPLLAGGEGRGGRGAALGPVAAAVGRLAAAAGRDLAAFARHPAGSVVLRALLRVLAGAPGAGIPQLPPQWAEPTAKWAEPTVKGAELPPSFPPLLEQLAEAFNEQLPSLLSPASASLCLQVALEVLWRSRSPACSRLCDAVIGQLAPPGPDAEESALVRGLQDPERGRLLEAAMMVLEPSRLRQLFRQQLKGRLLGVATHRLANHGLQRLLDHAPEDVVGEVLSELGPALAQPLARGHPGVLTALLGACRCHPRLQPQALRHLFQAFGCWEPPQRRRACVGLLAGLRPFEGGAKDDEGAEPQPSLGPVTLHGSLLLQHLLHFADPGPALAGLGTLPPPQLAALARSPSGSRVWDALLSSPSVPRRARRRLLRRLQGHYVSLACHRNGSRVLDAVWASASSLARAAIAAELAPHRDALRRDPHGRGVARALALDLFCRHRRRWEELQAAPPRRCGMMGKLLED